MIAQAHGIRRVPFRAHTALVGPDAFIRAGKTDHTFIHKETKGGKPDGEKNLFWNEANTATQQQFGVGEMGEDCLEANLLNDVKESLNVNLPVVQEATVEEDLIALIKQLIMLFLSLKHEIREKRERNL